MSIAVLPFANVSGDPGQEFFSDGMTDEIIAALAKVPSLQVVARTSAFQFKGEKKDMRAIGQALSARFLIDGSVRKAGNRVRITAQLVQADNGVGVWTDSYDRELTDVFAIQEDIARAIATSLRMPLGLKPGENLVRNRNVDPDSHEKFLRAKALYDGREGAVLNYAQAESLLTDAIAKNPDYALAFALLAAVHYEHANSFVDANEPVATIRARIDDLRTNGEAAAKRAIDADPNLAWGYAMSAVFTWSRSKPQEAEELFLKALALDPADPYALDEYTNRLGTAGRLKDALATAEKAHAVEPFQPGISRRTVANLWLSGNNDAAIAIAKTLRAADRVLWLTRIYASMGRYDEAADALMETASDPNSAAAQAVRLLRTAPTKATSSESLPRLPRTLEYVYLFAGAPERALGPYARMGQVDYFWGNNGSFFWHPVYAPVRKSEEFKNLVRKAGLVEYWRAKGWPDLCRPIGADDFVCD
jgi:TolB-like protein/Tfp pilus assembly protein PilF